MNHYHEIMAERSSSFFLSLEVNVELTQMIKHLIQTFIFMMGMNSNFLMPLFLFGEKLFHENLLIL